MKKTKKTAKAKVKPVAKKKTKPTSKSKTKKTKKAEKTHILAIIDKSGSMGPIAKDAMGGFNTFLAEQKKLKDKATMSVVLFSNHNSIVPMYDGKMIPLNDVEELTPKNYIPEGSTALNDAIVQSMTKLKLNMNDMKKSQRPDKVLVIIVTDGDENASREYPKSKTDEVKKLINVRKEENWQFMFLCSTEDTALAGENLGISKGNTFQFTNDSVGNTQMYAKLSFATSSYRSMSLQDKGFVAKAANLLADDDDTTTNVAKSVSTSTDDDDNA